MQFESPDIWLFGNSWLGLRQHFLILSLPHTKQEHIYLTPSKMRSFHRILFENFVIYLIGPYFAKKPSEIWNQTKNGTHHSWWSWMWTVTRTVSPVRTKTVCPNNFVPISFCVVACMPLAYSATNTVWYVFISFCLVRKLIYRQKKCSSISFFIENFHQIGPAELGRHFFRNLKRLGLYVLS